MAPTLTATAQSTAGSTPVARVLLVLTWPGIQTATIQRLDPDGTWRNVRNAEPVACIGSCAMFDHEAPLDQPVSYRATSPQGSGAVNVNPYFESGVANWTGGNGATIASSGTQHHEGSLALRLTPNGSTANPNVQAEEEPVTVGVTYGAQGWLWSTNSFSTWGVGIAWYTSGHAFISTSATRISISASTWTYISGAFVAPPTAAFGRLVVEAIGTPAAANVLYVDEAMMTSPAALTVTSSPVTVPSGGQAWLTHPGHPQYAAPTDIVTLDTTYAARRGQFWPIGAALPVTVTDTRGGGQGTVVWQADTLAEYQLVRKAIADGGVLLMQLPATWSGDTWYIASGDINEVRVNQPIATDNWRRYEMPFQRVDRPTGAADGAVGQTWNDVKATYATWNAVKAAKATWTALNQSVV